jgi:hypothetical protein
MSAVLGKTGQDFQKEQQRSQFSRQTSKTGEVRLFPKPKKFNVRIQSGMQAKIFKRSVNKCTCCDFFLNRLLQSSFQIMTIDYAMERLIFQDPKPLEVNDPSSTNKSAEKKKADKFQDDEEEFGKVKNR